MLGYNTLLRCMSNPRSAFVHNAYWNTKNVSILLCENFQWFILTGSVNFSYLFLNPSHIKFTFGCYMYIVKFINFSLIFHSTRYVISFKLCVNNLWIKKNFFIMFHVIYEYYIVKKIFKLSDDWVQVFTVLTSNKMKK